MNIELSQIPKFLLYILLFYFFVKFVQSIVDGWKVKLSGQSKEEEFEKLVQNKLTSLKALQNIESGKNASSTLSSNLLLTIYQNGQNMADNFDLKSDYKRTIQLIEKSKWGDTPDFQYLTEKFESIFSIPVHKEDIISSFKFLSSNQVFLQYFEKNKNNLPTYKEIQNLICLTCLYRQIVQELIEKSDHNQTSGITQKICENLEIKRIFLEKSLFYLFHNKSSVRPIQSSILSQSMSQNSFFQNKSIDKYVERLLFVGDSLTINDFESLKGNLAELSKIINAITPLIDISQIDDRKKQTTALVNLRLESRVNQLESQYKKMVQLYHPDKFTSYKLNDLHMATIRTNFIIIKDSYEYLTKFSNMN